MWSDWLVVCDCGFILSAFKCPLSEPTDLLGFLLPWTWCISSWLLQQSEAAAPYPGRGVAPLGHAPALPQPPHSCTTAVTVLLHRHCSWSCINCGYICNWSSGDSWYLYFFHQAAGSLSLDPNIAVVMQLDHCRSYGGSSNSGLALKQFSHSVVSDSVQLHGLQHARIPCPSPTPGT